MGTIEKMREGNAANKPYRVDKISEKTLEDEKNKYNKCCKCWAENKKKHWSYDKLMSMPNVKLVKTKEYYDNKGEPLVVFETYYKCQECGELLTVQDYERAYCAPYRVDNGKATARGLATASNGGN